MKVKVQFNREPFISAFVVGVWDGLDECKISFHDILSQSCPVLRYGCLVMIH